MAPAGGGALHGVGAHASGLRAIGRRELDGDGRRPRAVLPLVHRGRRARPPPPARPVDRRVDGGGDGGHEPARDRPARARVARRAQARDRRDPRRLLLPGGAAPGDDRPRPEDDSRVGGALRPAADARRDGDRHAQPGDDGAAGVEALHAQSAARAFPAARDEPGADRVGARGPHRARRVRRAVPPAPAERHAVRARGLWPPAAHRAARRLRAPRDRLPGKAARP